MTIVGSVVTARCGDAPTSPPWPQPKSLAAAPLVVSKQALSALTLVAALLAAGCATSSKQAEADWPRYVLHAELTAQLNLPGGQRFDASGLLLTPSGDLLTVNDLGPTLYRIEMRPDGASADVVPLPNCFTEAQLAPFAPEKFGRYDCEGIAHSKTGDREEHRAGTDG